MCVSPPSLSLPLALCSSTRRRDSSIWSKLTDEKRLSARARARPGSPGEGSGGAYDWGRGGLCGLGMMPGFMSARMRESNRKGGERGGATFSSPVWERGGQEEGRGHTHTHTYTYILVGVKGAAGPVHRCCPALIGDNHWMTREGEGVSGSKGIITPWRERERESSTLSPSPPSLSPRRMNWGKGATVLRSTGLHSLPCLSLVRVCQRGERVGETH